MRNTAPATAATPPALAAAVRRRQPLQVAGTFAGLVALVLVLGSAMATAKDQGAVESLEKNYLEPVADAILAHEKG